MMLCLLPTFTDVWSFDPITLFHLVDRVGFLPGRKVFLPDEGEKQGRKYFCQGEMADKIVPIN